MQNSAQPVNCWRINKKLPTQNPRRKYIEKEIIGLFASKEPLAFTIRIQEAIMFYAIDLWPRFPPLLLPSPPPSSPGELLKSLGSLCSLDQPIPIPKISGNCRVGEFLGDPWESISSGLSCRSRGRFLICYSALTCSAFHLGVMCLFSWVFAAPLQQQALCARQKHQCYQIPYVSVLIWSWMQTHPRTTQTDNLF